MFCFVLICFIVFATKQTWIWMKALQKQFFYVNRYFIHFCFVFITISFIQFFLYLVCVTVCQNFPFYWIISKLRKSTLGKTKEMVRFIFLFFFYDFDVPIFLWDRDVIFYIFCKILNFFCDLCSFYFCLYFFIDALWMSQKYLKSKFKRVSSIYLKQCTLSNLCFQVQNTTKSYQ